MPKLRLSFACWNYDRTRALLDGSVQPDGIELNYLKCRWRRPSSACCGIASSTSPRCRSRRTRSRCSASEAVHRDPGVAVAVLPSLVDLREHAVGHPRAAGPDRQADRQPRVPDDRAGLDPRHPAGRVRRAGRRRHLCHRRRGGAGPQREAEARSAADVPGRADRSGADAVRRCSPTATSTRCRRRACLRPTRARTACRRLFENSGGRAGVLPAHADLPDHAHGGDPARDLRAAPWIAQSLYKAFARRSSSTYEDLQQTAALKTMLPWLTAHVEEARREMGEDFWPYGFDANRHVLETFLRYHHEQGLSKRRLEPEELFAARDDGSSSRSDPWRAAGHGVQDRDRRARWPTARGQRCAAAGEA